MLPKSKKKVAKPKAKAEIFSTFDFNLANKLKAEGFHVEEQKLVDGKLLIVFKESKQEIEKDNKEG